jgi:hypothetical protein
MLQATAAHAAAAHLECGQEVSDVGPLLVILLTKPAGAGTIGNAGQCRAWAGDQPALPVAAGRRRINQCICWLAGSGSYPTTGRRRKAGGQAGSQTCSRGAYEIGEYTLKYCEKKAEALSHCQLAALMLLQARWGGSSMGGGWLSMAANAIQIQRPGGWGSQPLHQHPGRQPDRQPVRQAARQAARHRCCSQPIRYPAHQSPSTRYLSNTAWPASQLQHRGRSGGGSGLGVMHEGSRCGRRSKGDTAVAGKCRCSPLMQLEE